MNLDDWAEAHAALKSFQDRLRSMIEMDLKEAEANVPRQSTIYHYTDVHGALGILQSGELWFTEREHLNDPVEIRHGLRIAHELFQTAAQERGAAIPRDVALRLTEEHRRGLETFGFWIFSASLEGDDLGQWRNYADDGRGVCFGFSLEPFNMQGLANLIPYDPSAEVGPNSVRFPVNYDDVRLRKHMQAYIDIGVDTLDKITLAARGCRYHDLYDRYERDLFCLLNTGFYGELPTI